MSAETTLAPPAQTKKTSVTSIIAAVVGVLILLVSLGVISFLVYENSTNGISSLFGYAVGQMLVWSLILLLARKKLDALQRFAIACLLTSAFMLFVNRQEMAFGLDTKEAQRIMAAERPTDPITLADKHPGNGMLRMIADAAKASIAAQAKLEALGNSIEPPLLNEEVPASAPRPKLVAYRDAARTAAANARAGLVQIDAIYREETETVRKTVSLYAPSGALTSMMGGVQRRQQRDGDLNRRMLNARAAFYEAIERSYAHLIDNYGQYQVDASGKVLYASTEAANRHNALAQAQNAAVAQLQAVLKDVERAQTYYQQGWSRFTSGGN